jgi:TRAP-type C4-dicarboxylate transport system substrate-binding protein
MVQLRKAQQKLVTLTVVGAVAGMSLALRVDAQDAPAQTTVSIATLAPAGSTWMNVFEAWNREIRRESAKINQPMRLQFFAGGVQGDESEVIRKIRAGRLDGAAVTAVGLAQIHRPALTFQIPGMFAGYAQLDAARTALNTEICASFNTAGFELMGWADVGRSRIFSQTAIQTPQQLATQRPWVWRDDSVMPAFYRTVSANAVALQVPEVLSALQTNRINLVVTSPPVAVQLQWSPRFTHMTDLPIATTIGATVIGRTKFNSLTAQQQQLLRTTGANYHQLARGALRRAEAGALTTLTTRGITVVTLDAAQRAAWDRVFVSTRTALTGQVADAAFIARVAQLGR